MSAWCLFHSSDALLKSGDDDMHLSEDEFENDVDMDSQDGA